MIVGFSFDALTTEQTSLQYSSTQLHNWRNVWFCCHIVFFLKLKMQRIFKHLNKCVYQLVFFCVFFHLLILHPPKESKTLPCLTQGLASLLMFDVFSDFLVQLSRSLCGAGNGEFNMWHFFITASWLKSQPTNKPKEFSSTPTFFCTSVLSDFSFYFFFNCAKKQSTH